METSIMTRIIPCMLVTVFAVGLGVAPAAADQNIELNIPIDLKKLMPEVIHIGVVCRILEDEPGDNFMANFNDRLGYGYDTVPVVDGSVQETLTMGIVPEPGHNFSSAGFVRLTR
jgi:hypothetical protein